MKTLILFSLFFGILAGACTGTDISDKDHRTIPDKGPYQYRSDSAIADSTSR